MKPPSSARSATAEPRLFNAETAEDAETAEEREWNPLSAFSAFEESGVTRQQVKGAVIVLGLLLLWTAWRLWRLPS